MSPDRPVRAVPTVAITFTPTVGKLDSVFTVRFSWSEPVNDFALGDIDVDGATTTSGLTNVADGDTAWTVEIETDQDREGKITVTVAAAAVTSKSTADENAETSAEREVDNKSPELVTATANEFKIVLVFHEEVDDNPNGDPPNNQFTLDIIDADGTTRRDDISPIAVNVEDEMVTLTLSSSPTDNDTIQPGDTVKLTYLGADRPLEDETGNDADTLTDRVIENLRKITRPGPVRNLAAEVTDTTIKLDWDQPLDTGGVPITGYRIQGAEDGGEYEELQSGDGEGHDNTEFTHEDLEAGESWEYVVVALNRAGAGISRRITAVTRNPRPGRPTRLTARADGDTAIDLSWTEPADTGTSDITGYKIDESTDAGANWTVRVANTGNKNTSYKRTGLSAGTTRHYRVSAINRSGAGEASDTAAATTRSADAPGAPTNLRATADGQTVIVLNWTAPADTGGSAITGYKIEKSTDGGTTWANQRANTRSTATTYRHTGLSADTTLHYRVSAINNNDTGGPSNVASATTRRVGGAPGRPTNLRARAEGSSVIVLNWTEPSDTGGSAITGYKIEKSPNGTSDWDNLIANTRSTSTSERHTGLPADTTLHYRVSAINSDSTGGPSNVASATTRDPSPPSPPRNLDAAPRGQNAIALDWDAPRDSGSSAITDYKIEASKDDTLSWSTIDDGRSTQTSYDHSGLDPGDTYYYRVSAINRDDSTSGPSNVASATTRAEVPGAPTDLDATAVGSTQIDLAWNEPEEDGGSPVTGYKIEMSPNGTSGWEDLEANTGSDATTYSDNTLSPNTTRHYRVSAINDAGSGPASDVAHATTSGTVPGRPTNLAATPLDTARIQLEWRAPDDDGGTAVSGYRIEVSEDGRPDSWVDVERNTESDDTDYTHTGLGPGSTRYYRVSAINSAGTGSPSRSAGATTLDVPDPPTGLVATANGKTRIDLDWAVPSDDGGSAIEGYRIDVSENGGATWSVLEANTQSTATDYPHTGLSPGETRHYRVFAINEWGRSRTSNIANATTDATEPGPPRDLVADANGKTQIVIDWSPPDEDGGAAVTGYKIEMSPNGTSGWEDLEANTGSTRTLYTDQDLDPGTTRHYRVAAINAVGAGEYSNVASATTAPDIPDAPSGLSAVADGTSRIDLSWNAPADDGGSEITGYRIEVSDNGTAWRNLRSDTQSDATEYTHTGLNPGTTQHYRVSAINAAGTGNPSGVASATTDPTFPDPPTGLAAAADGQTRIDLTWTAPEYDGGAPVTAYKVEVSADGGDEWTVLTSNTGSARTAYTHTGLRPGTTRHYRVSAINVAGSGLASNVAHATTDATVPDAPTGLAAAANGIDRIDLSWTEPGDDGGAPVTAYRIEVSTTRGATWTTLESNTGNTATAYSHTGIPPATRRDYRVSAINRVGAGDASNVADATTDPDRPDPPTGLAAASRGHDKIALSWTAPSYTGGVEITGYRIEVSDDAGATWANLEPNTGNDDTEYTHTGLDPASTRHYRVFSINVAGESEDPSETANATTDPVVPDAPTGLTAAADGTSRIDLAWSAPAYDGGAAITGYKIEVSVDGNRAWRVLESNTGNDATAYTHTGLDPATTRHYRVSAINRAGTGEASNVADATTDATVPEAPTRLRATADGTDRIDLAWTAPGFDGGAAIAGYRVEVSENAGGDWTDLAANTRDTTTAYSHTGLDPASTRHYRVSAINEIGTGAASNVADATTDATVPDPPTGLQAKASSPTQIDLTWTAPEYDGGAPVTSYRVEVSEDGATWSDLARSTGSTATAYSHTGLRPGSTRHYRVSAINVAGTGDPSGVATASTDDPVERAGRVNEAILPHFAAAATSSTLGAISARIEAVAARNPLPSQLRAAGLASVVGNLRNGGGLSAATLLNGTSFLKPLGGGAGQQDAGDGFGAAAWGSAEYTGMGQPDGEEVEWDGGMLSVHLGADMRVHRDFLAGMAASRSAGDYDFTDVTGARDVEGTYEARMNSVSPYLAWLPGRTGVAVWAAGSFGWGTVAVEDEFAGRRESDARTTTGAVGGSRILVASGASALRVRTEGWLSRVKVDETDVMDSLTLEMERARFALEWSQTHKFRSGDEVTVLLEGGARFGDGEGTDGAGMEFGGGMRYASPASGLTMEGHGRLLATGDSGYEEWGIRGLIQIDPQSHTGFAAKLVPAWGEPASGVQELWERGAGGGRGLAADMRKGRLNAEVEYGLGEFNGTPYGRMHLVDGGARAFGTGMRYEVSRIVDLRIEGTRTQSVGAPARHGLSLKGHWRF
ncbi:MAG: fibronectin type III domain-containing protein [Gemmatimonadota bacterium]|nr:fibronectin type III domain-containing protein [Gemmatimonadota bacterium]